VKSILQACQPRPDLLSATFNPEVFTANLAQVMDFYRGKAGVTENVYTDAVAGPGKGVRNRFLTERAGLARLGAWEDRNEQPMVDWCTTF
jgi:hypothetical protein